MSERDTPPWNGGSGGLLEVVDMMCEVTDTMARIIRKQAELIAALLVDANSTIDGLVGKKPVRPAVNNAVFAI